MTWMLGQRLKKWADYANSLTYLPNSGYSDMFLTFLDLSQIVNANNFWPRKEFHRCLRAHSHTSLSDNYFDLISTWDVLHCSKLEKIFAHLSSTYLQISSGRGTCLVFFARSSIGVIKLWNGKKFILLRFYLLKTFIIWVR